MNRRLNAFCLGALIAVASCPTQAAPAAPTVVSIGYRAPAECPSRARFLEEVLRRLSHVRVGSEGEGERHFEVEVESGAGETRARLGFVDEDSRRVQREISAPDCDEAVSGIALVTALAIDPRLSLAAPRREEDREPAPPVSPGPENEAGSASTADSAADKADFFRPVIDPAGSDPHRDREPGSSTAGGDWYWGLGAALGAVSDLAPSWAPNGLIFAEVGPGSSVRARLSFGYADSGTLDLSGRGARFRLAHSRAEICPLAASMGVIVLRPCTALELGSFHAAGAESTRILLTKSASGLWFAGLGALRAEIAFGRVFSLELQGQLRVPFLRRSYVFEQPDVPAYETPDFGGGVLIGAEARLE